MLGDVSEERIKVKSAAVHEEHLPSDIYVVSARCVRPAAISPKQVCLFCGQLLGKTQISRPTLHAYRQYIPEVEASHHWPEVYVNRLYRYVALSVYGLSKANVFALECCDRDWAREFAAQDGIEIPEKGQQADERVDRLICQADLSELPPNGLRVAMANRGLPYLPPVSPFTSPSVS